MRNYRLMSCAAVLLTAVALLGVGQASAQQYLENHYKVYEVANPSQVIMPITLVDQFGVVTVDTLTLEKFAIPTEKVLSDGTVYPIEDPFRHYTWWAFDRPEFVRRVDVLDQFGGYSWRVRNSRYLLTPAGKNQPDYPTNANHYKCYYADDAPVLDIQVTLHDQVDTASVVVVLRGEYFCNPVEKQIPGATFPIVDDLTHLACYRVENPTPYSVTYVVADQFGMREVALGNNTYLCVPAEKGKVVGEENSTWGRIKALYR